MLKGLLIFAWLNDIGSRFMTGFKTKNGEHPARRFPKELKLN